MTAGYFALMLALGVAWRAFTGATTDSLSSVSYSYDPHPDYPDCNNTRPMDDTIGDGRCDYLLDVAECGWDGGDCCACTCNSTYLYQCTTSDYSCDDPSAPRNIGDLGCHNVSFQSPSGPQCLNDEVDWVVNSTDRATALAEATLCSGGYFHVKWEGTIGVNATIYVVNGTRLHITGVSDAAADGRKTGPLFFVYNGSLDLKDMTITNGANSYGGAIILDAGSELFADNVEFSSNTAENMGGAMYVTSSKVELVSSRFHGNSAHNGGAMFVYNSDVIASGSTGFVGNNVSENGGALYILENSHVGWNMQRELIVTPVDFPSYFSASYYSYWYGYGHNYDTYYSWTVIDDSGETNFLNNSAKESGGSMYVENSDIYWSGKTLLERNTARYGGAIFLKDYANIVSDGVTTFASNEAIVNGGAIGAAGYTNDVSVNGSTTFRNNKCEVKGGAIDLNNVDFAVDGSLSFSHNSAVSSGGALYASQVDTGPLLIGVTFTNNTAESGGAVSFSAVGTDAYQFGDSESEDIEYDYASRFISCRFDSNSASSRGGAIQSAAGSDFMWNTTFVNNSAEIGGAIRVSGALNISNSSFVENKSGDGGGSAVSNGGDISKIAYLLFSGNGYHCSPDAFMDLNETTVENSRYEIVCDRCDIECDGCTIEDNYSTPVCSDLLDHTDSRGGIATLETLVLEPGYWRATNTSRNILACFNKKACKGGVTGDPKYCSTGYKGPYCAICSKRYVQTLSHHCSKCSSNTSFGPALFGVFTALAGVLLSLFLYYMIRIERGRTTRNYTSRLIKILAIQSLKIIIVSWQIITQFSAVANVVYPSLYQGLLDAIALVNFDFSWLLSAGCLDVDFYVGLIAATAGPVAVLILLGVTYNIALRRNHGSDLARRIVRRKHINAIILIAFLVYSSASSVIFRTFACDSLDDGKVYLRADYRIECDSPKHRDFMIYSGLMIIVYPLGIPVFFAILLFRNRKFLENVTLRTYNGELVQQSTSSLWKPYKPSVFYYEVVECGRRLVLAGIVVFIYPDTAAQIAVTLAMAFIFALMSERLNPYESKWDGWVARIGHVMIVLTMFVALLTKVDVSDEGTQSQNMFAVVLVSSHIAMILTGITEAILLIYTVQQNDSPQRRPRRIPVLPVDSFTSIHFKRGDRGLDDEGIQGKVEQE